MVSEASKLENPDGMAYVASTAAEEENNIAVTTTFTEEDTDDSSSIAPSAPPQIVRTSPVDHDRRQREPLYRDGQLYKVPFLVLPQRVANSPGADPGPEADSAPSARRGDGRFWTSIRAWYRRQFGRGSEDVE